MTNPPGPLPPESLLELQFTVPSSRGPDRYEVTLRRGVWFCTCPSSGRCWHKTYVRLVQEALGVVNFGADLQAPPPDLIEWLRGRNRRERAAQRKETRK